MSPSDHWHGFDVCFWLLCRDGGCHGISSDLAGKFHDTGELAVMLGTYAEAKAVALARQQQAAAPEKPQPQAA